MSTRWLSSVRLDPAWVAANLKDNFSDDMPSPGTLLPANWPTNSTR